ncbi:MAG: class I SAM-dependent methyltransferase, partial [Planctomycetota bacterium]
WCWIGREASAGYRNAVKTKPRAICSRHALDRRGWNPWSQWPIFNTLLDAGCGSGVLSKRLAEEATSCVGVDPSGSSVALARKYQSGPNITFFCATLEDYAGQKDEEGQFDLIAANMVLMDVIDMESFCLAANRLLKYGGSLVATVTHPCFWPKYWNYENAEWYSYQKEIVIEAELRIHAGTTHHNSTHVHRPLSEYFRVAAQCGFVVDSLIEPWPPTDAPVDYQANFTDPRFLGIRYRKSGVPQLPSSRSR